MNKQFFEQLVGRVVERLEVVARYDGCIGWVKDALKQGNLDGVRIDGVGNIYAQFSGIGRSNGGEWSDEVLVEPRFMEMEIEGIEKEFSTLAQSRDKEEKNRKQEKYQEELRNFKKAEKELRKLKEGKE